MPNCANCGIKLTQRELDAGTCDICGESLTAAPPRAGIARTTPAATGGYGGGTGLHMRGEVALEWGTVRGGLYALILGLLLVLVGRAGFLATLYAEQSAAGDRLGVAGILVGLASLALMFWGAGSSLTGLFMSAAVPAETGAKKWSVLACLMTLLILGVYLTLFAIAQRGPAGSDPLQSRQILQILGITLMTLGLLAGVFWSLFLITASRALGNRGLAAGCAVFLVVALVNAVAMFSLHYRDVLPGRRDIITEVDTAVFLVWHLFLLGMLRSTVSRAIAA